ncbi:MAG: esterase [Candidatus Riflebacteria bacterium]|nr:esterase [Candidatus Riflebacteria bacterium]
MRGNLTQNNRIRPPSRAGVLLLVLLTVALLLLPGRRPVRGEEPTLAPAIQLPPPGGGRQDRPLARWLKKTWQDYRYAGLTEKTLSIGGHERRFLLYVPPGVTGASAPMPLVLAIHGGGGNMWSFSRFVDFRPLAASEGFLLAYPNAFDKNWNEGRVNFLPEHANLRDVDDVRFLTSLVAAVGKEYPVDAKRVFAAGISNGGFMSQYLAIRDSGTFAAIAAVTATMGEAVAASFTPTLPVSVMIINGTEDPLVPYDGGEVKILRTKRGRCVSTAVAVDKWVTFNGCASPPAVAVWPDVDPDDGCLVTASTWSGGRAGTEVVLLKVAGGGHTWPGGGQYLPQGLIGRVCRDFAATTVIWQFFRSHPRP